MQTPFCEILRLCNNKRKCDYHAALIFFHLGRGFIFPFVSYFFFTGWPMWFIRNLRSKRKHIWKSGVIIPMFCPPLEASAVYICSYLVSPTVRSFCDLLEILFETFRWNNYPSWLTNNFTRAIFFLLWTNSNSQFLKSYMQNWKSTSLHVISSTPTIK